MVDSGFDNSAMLEQEALEVGKQLYGKLDWTQKHPLLKDEDSPPLVPVLSKLRGKELSKVWLIEIGGSFPMGPIFRQQKEDARFAGNTTYSYMNEAGSQVLGVNFQSATADGVNRNFFLEVSGSGKIEALVNMGTSDSPNLQPLDVIYPAMPEFIEKRLHSRNGIAGDGSRLPDY